MADLISSDRAINGRSKDVLKALLDTLVPASGDGRMPSAADTDFIAHLERFDPSYIAELKDLLVSFDTTFASLQLEARVARVSEFAGADSAAFRRLLQCVYDCYYQDVRVRAAIGVNPGPQYPHGNTVTAGDLSLLDPVIRDSSRHRYRSA